MSPSGVIEGGIMPNLVLLRHGESLFNSEGRFTGWMDVDLSERGRAEAREAGRLMRGSGLAFDVAFTSVLKRAIRTLWIVLDEMDRMWIPTVPSWRLNERSYGALEGKLKSEMDEKYGFRQVHLWRRGFSERPPAHSKEDRRYPGRNERYRDVDESLLPRTESLQDTFQRVMPFWEERIFPELEKGKNVLVVSHGNTIRALVKQIESISDRDIENFEIGTARPLLYEIDERMIFECKGYLAPSPPASHEEEGMKR